MVGGVRVPVGQAPSSRGSALREVGSSSLLARRSPVLPKAGAGWRPAAPEAGVRGCDRRTGRPGPLCVEKAPVWAAVGGIRLPRICCCARGEGPPPTLESLQCALASSNSTTRPTPTLPSPPPHQPVPGPLARSVAISARTGRFSPGWLAVPCRGTLAGKGPAVKRGRAAGGGGGLGGEGGRERAADGPWSLPTWPPSLLLELASRRPGRRTAVREAAPAALREIGLEGRPGRASPGLSGQQAAASQAKRQSGIEGEISPTSLPPLPSRPACRPVSASLARRRSALPDPCFASLVAPPSAVVGRSRRLIALARHCSSPRFRTAAKQPSSPAPALPTPLADRPRTATLITQSLPQHLALLPGPVPQLLSNRSPSSTSSTSQPISDRACLGGPVRPSRTPALALTTRARADPSAPTQPDPRHGRPVAAIAPVVPAVVSVVARV